MTSKFHITLFAMIVAIAGVGRAEAQQQQPPVQRPFRGLFGGAQPANTRGQMVDLSMSAFVGWDEPQTVVNPLESTDDRTIVSGPFSGGAAAVSYTHPGERLNFTGTGSAFTGYFPDNNEDPWYNSYSGSANLSWNADLSRRTHFAFSEGASSSTDFRVGGLLGGAGGSIGSMGSTFDNSLVHDPAIVSQTNLHLTHDFSLKSSAYASYGFQYAHFFHDDSFPDTGIHSVGAGYIHRLTKSLGYHLGYSYNHPVEFGGDNDQLRGIHNVDAGLDYGKAVSLTRTTKLAFSAGTTIASATQQENGQTTFGSPHVYGVGNISLGQELGQSWSSTVFYNRSLNYTPGFTQPGIFDTAGASLSGLVSRHLDVSLSALYQVGRIGLGEQNYRSWNAFAQVRSAITRNIAAYAYYYYYLSDLGTDVALPVGVPRYVDRNGVRAGITAWLPLWYGRGAP
jgi:hypothetical protein